MSRIGTLFRKIVLSLREKEITPVIIEKYSCELLKGKIALITGGSSGIGLAIAEAFIKSGAKVIIAGSSQDKLSNALARLDECVGAGLCLDDVVAGLVLDVRQIDEIPDKIEYAAKLFSENRIDILVNSAGCITKNVFWDIQKDEYEAVMDTNVKGTYFMCQVMGKYMIKNSIKGHILNVTSASALRPAWTPYQMSKWTIKGFTLGLADLLLPYGIVVNAIAPGPTATPMLQKQDGDSIYNNSNPSRRYALPEEIASLAVHLVSGAGDYVVGDTFYITGGGGNISMHK